MSVRTVKAKPSAPVSAKRVSYMMRNTRSCSAQGVALTSASRDVHFRDLHVLATTATITPPTNQTRETTTTTKKKKREMEYSASEAFMPSTYEGIALDHYDWGNSDDYVTAIEIPPLEQYIQQMTASQSEQDNNITCQLVVGDVCEGTPIMLPCLDDEDTSYISSPAASSSSTFSSPNSSISPGDVPVMDDAPVMRKAPKRRNQPKKMDPSIVTEDISCIINSNRLRKPKTDLEPNMESFASKEEYIEAYKEWRKRRELNNEKSRKSRMERKRMDKSQAEDIKNILSQLQELQRQVNEMKGALVTC